MHPARYSVIMEVDLFEFQSDSFPNVEGDFLSEDTGLIDFENTEFESVNFDHVPDLLRRDIPDLSSGDGSLEVFYLILSISD